MDEQPAQNIEKSMIVKNIEIETSTDKNAKTDAIEINDTLRSFVNRVLKAYHLLSAEEKVKLLASVPKPEKKRKGKKKKDAETPAQVETPAPAEPVAATA